MKKLLILMAAAAAMTACQDRTMPEAILPEIDTTNPLLAEWDTKYATPPFEKITLADYEPAFDTAIAVARARFEAIISNPEKPTFYNTIVALAECEDLLNRIASVFFNLESADTSDEMDAIALRLSPKLTELSNDISLNPEIFARVKAVYEHPGWGLDKEDRKLLEDTYKGFVRSGANLTDEEKELYRKYTTELSQTTLKFKQNSLASTNAYTLNITDPKKVEELPEFVREVLASDAKARGEKGWTVTLKANSVRPFMTYSTQRDLKQQLSMASGTIALGGQFDNTENIRTIVNLRLAIANLLGYGSYADYALDDRMAENAGNVRKLLNELLEATISPAREEIATLAEYARADGLEGEFMPWDRGYYMEKYQKEKYAVSDAEVKPYFQLENVRDAIFMLANKLYGITYTPATDIQVYHPDVTAYEVTDEDGEFLGVLYLDPFPRASKRSGAWMTEFRGARGETRPLVSLVMNFTKPSETAPSLLTFDEVQTFMHEFGHSLHGMLAKGKYESLNGTNVYRDFVELPSQIMENWAFEKDFLNLWARHYQTGETMPEELVEKLVAAKNYMAAYSCVRQLSFGILDMAWHSLEAPFEGDVIAFENEAEKPTEIQAPIPGTAMSPSFNHIFSGGYAAGYYSYKWAEVLSADGYSLFKETGIFNRRTAARFRALLEGGGKEHPMTLYVRFRGHKPETKALIEQMGLGQSK